MELRPYQQQMIDALMAGMTTERFLLVQAATGAGKTIIFSALVQRLRQAYPNMRILIVAHREILIRQAREKMLQVWPDGKSQIGLACSSVSQDVNVDAPVVIGSVQTLARRINQMQSFDMVIIDECHRVPPRSRKKKKPSQYEKLLDTLEQHYQTVRVLGVTATPYRLGTGYIYGPGAWWPELLCQVGINDLVEENFLVELRTKRAIADEKMLDDIENVGVNFHGDFKESELEDVMTKLVHITSAVQAFTDYGERRQHVVVFCVTILHAERVCIALHDAGYSATVIHSKMPPAERAEAMRLFESGNVQFVCNVGVLTEGWDCTIVDCLMMLRPTMSPALYIQMVGRGLRLHDGKKNCLLLDLVGNSARHGDIDDPIVRVGKEQFGTQKRTKTCPKCKDEVSRSAKVCPWCGYRWPETEDVQMTRMAEVTGTIKMAEVPVGGHAGHSRSSLPMRVGSYALNVRSSSVGITTSKKGNPLLRVFMVCTGRGESDIQVERVYYYFWFDTDAKMAWKAAESRRTWATLAQTPPPKTLDEAERRKSELHIPDVITVKRNRSNYPEVVRWSA